MEQKFIYIQEDLDRDFKFKIDENNNFIWENFSIKYVLSKPSVQSYDEYVKINSTKDFMYFYYTVEIYKRKYDYYDEENNKCVYCWDLVASRHTHDFPCLLDLDYILDNLLTIDLKKDGIKEILSENIRLYSKRYYTQGFGCDDFYDFTKILREEDGEIDVEHFIGYLGCTFNGNGDEESAGIRTPYLNREDIKELSKCVKAFLEYTIKKYNEATDEYIDVYSKNKFEIDGKLYVYETKFVDEKLCIQDNFESIYVKGDSIEVTYLTIDSKGNFCSINKNIIIKEIKNNNILSENGDIFEFEKILNFFEDMSEEKLKYNIQEVEDDFYSILTDYDFKYFKEASEDEIFEKYKEVIINRTWMCRNEHNFPNFISCEENDANIKNAEIVVKIIIHNIKQKL